jgi:hypothetical protein
MLIDVEDNRFLVDDIEILSRREQELFRRFIYCCTFRENL